ncbi:MAG: ATP-binding protein [Kofleriaceae bacterium]
MTRLRWKLLTAMVALAVVTIGVSALLARRVTHDQVRRLLVAQHPQEPLDGAVAPLEEYLTSTGGWRDVDAVIDRIVAAQRCRIVLTTLQGEPIAVSADLRALRVTVVAADELVVVGERGGQPVRFRLMVAPLAIHDAAGRTVAHAYVLPADAFDDGLTSRELAAVDRRLIATFAIALLVALLLTIAVSRRITRPIEQLTAAVQAMGRGRMPAHVEVRGRDEIARLATSFNQMADAVTAQEALRRRMVGDVAHELRTPLTNLRCELEAIQDGLAAPDPARVASLHEEVLHLQRLVDDLQDLAVAEAGALKLALARIDLGATVARIVGAAADVAWDDGIVVDADVTRLRQIVDNVVANALRHSPDGARVRVRVARAGADATVAVIDRGPGIPAADLERIFERFYRVDAARGRAEGGSGLGLAIVRRLVELHHGRVWADRGADGGATITFAIPLASSSGFHIASPG